jgi:hypothetical protein
MKATLDRTILKIVRHDGRWAVEHDGNFFGHSPDKDVVKASAHKKAMQLQDGGHACEVRVAGELWS